MPNPVKGFELRAVLAEGETAVGMRDVGGELLILTTKNLYTLKENKLEPVKLEWEDA
jgi:hypothetical protein